MTTLLDHLRQRISLQGPLSVSDYMAEALSNPRFGYYMGRDPFGARGDFITAPEVSQMFGELLGLWAGVMWQQLGSPSCFHLIEMGPGRGTLMSDALRALSRVPGFQAAAKIHLVEISPALVEIQKQALAKYGFDVSWHKSLDEVPHGPFVMVSNELFDALPIRQFQRVDHGWGERLIDVDPETDQLRFICVASPAASAMIPLSLQKAEVGSIVEVRPAADALALGLAQRLVENAGAVLALDYGHAQSGYGDTFQALRAHKYHDVLKTPGEADLTAHVDFDALGQAFEQGGAKVWPVVEQGEFLLRLGIEARAQSLMQNASNEQRLNITQALARLCDASQMGKLFKVLCATSPGLQVPPAFEDSK